MSVFTMHSKLVFKAFAATLTLLLLALAQLPGAQAANGQCRWEGGPGSSGGHSYCAAEDCAGNGGFAQCSSAVGDATSESLEPELGPDKWKYDMCDHNSADMGIIASWCHAGGGEWLGANQGGCVGLPSGVFSGGSATNTEGSALSIARRFADGRFGSNCGATPISDTGWGATLSSSVCWSGSDNTDKGILIRSLRKQVFQATGPGCTSTLSVSYLKTRAATCPAGYKSRDSVTGPECYKERCPGGCYTIGNPTSPFSGAKLHQEADFNPSSDIGIEFTRYYNSGGFYRPTRMTAHGNPSVEEIFLDDYWGHTYSRRLIFISGNTEVTALARRPDGSVRIFDQNGVEQGTISGSKGTLTELPGVGWDLTLGSRDVERYDTEGKLVSITTRHGRITTLTYVDGRLATVTGPFGHTLNLVVDGDGLLQSVSLPGGELIEYGYDSWRRLATVTRLGRATRTYGYQNIVHMWLLTEIADDGVLFAEYTYDSLGRVTDSQHAGGRDRNQFSYTTNTTTVTDPWGAVTTHTFSKVGGMRRIASISQPCAECGDITTFTYDANGNPSATTGFDGTQTLFIYDSVRNLQTWRTEAANSSLARVITTQWHPTYRFPTQIEEPGRRTNLTYDAQGNLLTQSTTDTSSGASRTWTFTYDTLGRMLTADGPRSDVNDVSTFTYHECSTGNECGQLATATNAAGHVTEYLTYNAHGQPLTVEDPNGLLTTIAYDHLQRVTSWSEGSAVTAVEYWPNGLLRRVTQPGGGQLNYSYDDARRVTAVTDVLGNRIVYTLSLAGDVTREDVYDSSNTLVRTRTASFNTLGQRLSDTGSQSQTTSYEYDAAHRVTQTSDPLGRLTQFGYDVLGRETSITDPTGRTIQLAYDARDNLISVTDPRQLVTQYARNGFDELTLLTSPDTGVSSQEYHADGRIEEATDSRGRAAQFQFDAMDRPITTTYGDQIVTSVWDSGPNALGRLSQLSNGAAALAWTYDARGHVLTETQTVAGVARQTTHAYNPAGQRISTTTPSGQLIEYQHANGLLSGIKINGVQLLDQVLYQPFGPTRGWRWGNGTYTVREFDLDGRVTTIDSAQLATYQYNLDGTIASITDESEAPTSSGDPSLTINVSNNSNRLESVDDGTVRGYSYDAAGNTLTDGNRTFTYDDSGRMVQSVSGSLTTQYSHNALGQRVLKQSAAGTRFFTYDDAGHLVGVYGPNGVLVEEIVWFEDTPVATIRNTQGGGIGFFYIHTDHLDTPTRLTEPANNAVMWRWDRDPYGNGPPNEDAEENGAFVFFNLRFPGQYFDDETGLHYNYFRDYDPAVGRYVESDPIGLDGGLNTFAYVNGNPASAVDPLGLRGLPAYNPLTPRTGFPLVGSPTGPSAGPMNKPPLLVPWYLEPPNTWPLLPDDFFEPAWQDTGSGNYKNKNGELLSCSINDGNECRRLIARIAGVIFRVKGQNSLNRGLQERYVTQLHDPGNFYAKNRQAWDDHNTAIQQLINEVNNLIKEAHRLGCTVPYQYLQWANMVPPARPWLRY